MPDNVVLVRDLLPFIVGAGVLGLLACIGIAVLLLPRLRRSVLPKPVETRLAQYLPFDRILDDGATVKCKDQSLSRVIEITGIDQAFLREGEQVSRFLARKAMIDNVAEMDVSLRFYLQRSRARLAVESDFSHRLAAIVARRWNRQFENSFMNRLFVVLSVPPSSSEKKLDEAMASFMNTIADYGPRVLSTNPADSTGNDITVASFWGSIVSPLSLPQPHGHLDLSDALAADAIEFLPNGRLLITNGDDVLHAAIIGVRRMGDNTSSLMSGELGALPHPMTIMQVCEPYKKATATGVLIQNRAMMAQSALSAATGDQYQVAMELVEGVEDNRATLCRFAEIIVTYGETEEEVLEAESAIRQALLRHGYTAVREGGVAQASWFMQFPSVKIWPRIYRIFSTNIANLVTFDRPPPGLPRSAWGNGAIATFKTGAGTAYRHQFHATADLDGPPVAHGLCIAPTGGGKTTLFTFLSMMAMRHPKMRSYVFDRMRGAYVYTTAMGGDYLSFNAESYARSVSGGMNPFQCEPTTENLSFLKLWLQGISRCDDQDSLDQISRAIDIAYTYLEPQERSLAMLHQAAFTPGSKIYNELKRWTDPRQYGGLFNAKQDVLNTLDKRLVTYDMTTLFNDPRLAGASISYILHRIRLSMTHAGSPGLIFIDETEPMLRDPEFKKIYLVMLQEFRKIGGAVISVFQRPEALNASDVAQAVRQQCAVYYLFPNPGAKAEDYADFDLNEREMEFILGLSPLNQRVRRGLLIKRPGTRESVVVDVDLSPLGPLLSLFSSSSSDVMLASNLQSKHTENWVTKYVEAAGRK